MPTEMNEQQFRVQINKDRSDHDRWFWGHLHFELVSLEAYIVSI